MNKKKKKGTTHVKPHKRSNPKSRGKHHVTGHTRRTTKKVKDAVNKVTPGRKVGGSGEEEEEDVEELWNKVQWQKIDSFSEAERVMPYIGEGFASGEIGTGWMADEPYKVLAEYDELRDFSDYPFDADARAWTETLQFEQKVGKHLFNLAESLYKDENNIPEDEDVDTGDYLGYYTELEGAYLRGFTNYKRENYLNSLKENKDNLTKSEIETSLEALDNFPEYGGLPSDDEQEARRILYEAQGKDISDLPTHKKREITGMGNKEKSLEEF